MESETANKTDHNAAIHDSLAAPSTRFADGPATLNYEPSQSEEAENAGERQNKEPPPNTISILDLMAQWVMALATILILLVTWRGLVYIKATYRASKGTLKQSGKATQYAKHTSDVTREIGEAQVRAYIEVASVHLTLLEQADAGGPMLTPKIDAVFENYGNTPAKNFNWNVELRFPKTEEMRTFVKMSGGLYPTQDVIRAGEPEASYIQLHIGRLTNADFDRVFQKGVVADIIIHHAFTDVFGVLT